MRSWLFVPGDDAKKLEKSLSCGSDVVIVDLEDSVAADNKGKARICALEFLKHEHRSRSHSMVYIRVNSLDSDLIDSDLDTVMTAKPDGIVLPKSRSGEDIAKLGGKLAIREALHDIHDGSTPILAIATETAASVFSLGSYGNISPRLTGLAWGGEDLAAEIGASSSKEEIGGWTEPFRLVRNLCLLGAAAAGVERIDTVFTNLRDLNGLAQEANIAARDGFTGKLAIHPNQVPIINTAFTPSDTSVEAAREIVELFEAAAHSGKPGVIAYRGEMLDRPHLLAARRLIESAEKIARNKTPSVGQNTG